MRCIFCKSQNFTLTAPTLRDSSRHKVVKCSHCNLVQISPTPTQDSDKRFYDEGRQAKNIGSPLQLKKLRPAQRADTLRRADFITRFLKPKAYILDIGSGYGFFLAEMKKRKFKVIGLEISKAARTIAKKVTNAEILNLDILSQKFDRKFDLITAFHVLEHITRPVEMLKKLSPLLKKNGKLIIEVPNLDDWMLAKPAYRKFYWQRAHVLYFNRHTLTKTIKKAGFTKIKFYFVQRYGLENVMNWLINARPQIGNPSFIASSHLRQLEQSYKQRLEKQKRSDTMIAVISSRP